MRTLRLPLSTGATTAGMLLFGMFSLLGALFALALLIPIMRTAQGQDPRQKLIWLVPFGFFVASIFFHLRALRARASDVLLDETGLRIEGGPHHGLQLPWETLDLSGCRTEMNYNASVTAGNDTTYEQRLILRKRDGQELVVATSLDATEQDSFAALLSTLLALRSGTRVDPSAPSPRLANAQVLTCKGCGAPVVPADAATSHCAFCGAETPIPDEVRERVRRGSEAQAAHRRESARIERLLSRPRADKTNRWLLGALIGKYLSPFVLLFAWRYWLTVLALIWVLGRVVKSKLAARRIFQRLILDYTATPTAPGQPLLCRRCAGALPPAPAEAVLTRCAYCQADNLIGIDIHQHARAVEHRASELFVLLLRERAAEFWQWVWIFVGLGVAVYGVVRGLNGG